MDATTSTTAPHTAFGWVLSFFQDLWITDEARDAETIDNNNVDDDRYTADDYDEEEEDRVLLAELDSIEKEVQRPALEAESDDVDQHTADDDDDREAQKEELIARIDAARARIRKLQQEREEGSLLKDAPPAPEEEEEEVDPEEAENRRQRARNWLAEMEEELKNSPDDY